MSKIQKRVLSLFFHVTSVKLLSEKYFRTPISGNDVEYVQLLITKWFSCIFCLLLRRKMSKARNAISAKEAFIIWKRKTKMAAHHVFVWATVLHVMFQTTSQNLWVYIYVKLIHKQINTWLAFSNGAIRKRPSYWNIFFKGIWQYIFILAYRQEPLK